jgi:copper resistance protein C
MNNSRLRSLFYDVLRAGLMTAIAVMLVVAPRVASAHAVLVISTPAANSTVAGPDVPITMKFNSRVDATRSTVRLLLPDGSTKPLTLDAPSTPDTITAKAGGLAPGKYAVQWQVLAVDGHITRGQIPFVVK